jgi:hypothetical protein
MIKTYTKEQFTLDLLEKEIRDSAITIALDFISALGNQITIAFKATLSAEEEVLLETIVANHIKIDVPVIEELIIKQMPEPPPFANPSGFRSRYRGYHFGTVAAGTTASLDIKIPATRFLQGVQLLITNGAIGDNASLEVVDVDGIMGYGTNLVLDRFGDNWFIDPQNILQRELVSNYTAQIIGGLYIRIIYESVGTQDVGVYANLMLHVRQ